MSASSYVGISTSSDWKAAGKEAAEKALSFFKAAKPKLIIILCSEDAEYASIYKAVNQLCDTPIIGAKAAYLYTSQGVLSKGVAIMACDWDGELVGPQLYHRDLEIEKVRHEFSDELIKHRNENEISLFTIWSGYNYISNVSEDWYNTFGPKVNIFGGGCTVVYLEDKEYTDCGLVLGIVSKDKFEYVLGHGSKPEGRPLVITRAEDNRIYEIDGTKATDVYTRLCDEITEKLGSSQRYQDMEWFFAFGYPTTSGEYVLQEPICIDQDTGIIHMFLQIPNNSVVRILVCRQEDILYHSAALIDDYISSFRYKPKFNFIINCLGRVNALEHYRENEIQLFRQALGEDNFLGFASNGELGIPKGMPVYTHQKTLIIFGA
jgi:hypothetical protein